MSKSKNGFVLVSGLNTKLIERVEMRLAVTDEWYLVSPGTNLQLARGSGQQGSFVVS